MPLGLLIRGFYVKVMKGPKARQGLERKGAAWGIEGDGELGKSREREDGKGEGVSSERIVQICWWCEQVRCG